MGKFRAARFDLVNGNGDPLSYVIEYRHPDRWDSGIGTDAVLVHEVRQNGLSYLKSSLTAGQQYVSPDYGFVVEVDSISLVTLQVSVTAGRKASVPLRRSNTSSVTPSRRVAALPDRTRWTTSCPLSASAQP